MDIFLKRQIFRVVHSHWALRETDLDGHGKFYVMSLQCNFKHILHEWLSQFFDNVEEAVSTIKEVTSLLTFG